MNKKNPIKIIESESYISDEDKEMDIRARSAVRSAVSRAEICKKPIAKYDVENKRAYIEYADGRKEYV